MKVIISSIDYILNFSTANSLTALLFGNSCCAIELSHIPFSQNYTAGINVSDFKNSPKHADLLICAGPVNVKSASYLIDTYNQMPEPRYIIAVGACACLGGMFSDSYASIKGIDSILPVDIYLPGCPPRPEAILDAVKSLKKRIKLEAGMSKNDSKTCDSTALTLCAGVKDLNIEHSGVK